MSRVVRTKVDYWRQPSRTGKSYLSEPIGSQILNYREFNTVLIKVEEILNSRPISYRKVDQNIELLTLGHFVAGSSLLETPLADDSSFKLTTSLRLWR